MKSTLRTIALAIAVASFVSGSASGQGITLGRPGQAPLCTHSALHAGTCQQAVAGYHATVTNANGAAANPCASDAGTGSAQITCRYVTGSGWTKWEPGEGGGGANLSSSADATTVTVASDSGADASLAAATPSAAGVMAAADKAKLDGFSLPFDKIVVLDDPATACAEYTAAFEEYHDGTAPAGWYRVKVVGKLEGANALVPQAHYWDDGGNWPYKACFVHHASAAGAYINTTGGAFPDTLGRLTNGAGAVTHSADVKVFVDIEGDFEIDKTGLAKNALLWDLGGSYLAGCDEGGTVDDLCGSTVYGTMNGSLHFRGDPNLRIKTKNDGSWTGQGTPSMSKTVRLSGEAPSFHAFMALNGATYSDLNGFSLHPANMGHTDIAYHQVNSWGTKQPRIDASQSQDGIGAMLYAFINATGAPRNWSVKNLDHAVMLGDANNGGYTIFYESCDALDTANGTCGTVASGIGLGSVTTGVNLDGLMAEGGSGSYSTISIPILGPRNRIVGLYAEQTSNFTGTSIAIGPQYCDGTSGVSPKPKGTIVANDSECATSGGVAAPAPNGATAVTNGVLELGFMHGPTSVGSGGKTILLGDACTADKTITITGPDKLPAMTNGTEFAISTAIASTGGCRVIAATPAADGQMSHYYNLTQAWHGAPGSYPCDAYQGADMAAKCQAAYDDAKAALRKVPVITAPRGYFGGITTKMDFCDESGATGNSGVIFVGQGGNRTSGSDGRAGTIFEAAAGFVPAAVNKNGGTYQVFPNVDTDETGSAFAAETSQRDEVECSACDFLAAGITRGSLVEFTGWADASNNFSKAVGKHPLKVYRVTQTRLIVESEASTNATLIAPTAGNPTTVGEIRLLKPMVETCGGMSVVQGMNLDGNFYADMLVHHRPDNSPVRACAAADVPYDGSTGGFAGDCTGLATGTGMTAAVSIGGGLRNVWGYDPVYYGAAHTSLEQAGQADHWTIEDGSHFWGGWVSVWYDGLQAQPGITVRDSQLEAFQRSGLWVSSGTGILDGATIISNDADCIADTFGQSAHIWVGYENVVGVTFAGKKTNIETRCGQGIHVVDGGTQPNHVRYLNLADGWIQANDPDVTDLISAPNACLSVNLEGTRFIDNTGPPSASQVTFGNSNQSGSCKSWIAGRWASYDSGAVGFAPEVVINDGIPVGVMSDSFLTSINGGAPNGTGASIHWSRLVGVPAGFADGTDDGGGGSGYATIQDEGTPLTQRNAINLIGAGVTCADDSGNGRTNCTIPGGGSSAFSALTGGTNTSASMLVGTGAALAPTGSGIVQANYVETIAGSAPASSGNISYDTTAGALEYGDAGVNRTVVNTDEAQTLSNKTLVAPALGTPVSGVATNLTGTAAGLTAGAATALAANGANCSAGQYPLGVNASGAVESCTADDDVPDAGEVNDTALAAGAVDGGTGGEIEDDTITAADIAPNAVTASELADNAVDTGAIADDAVTPAKVDSTGDYVFGSVSTGDWTTEPGNRFTLNDNDTAFANDPTCANSGAAGLLTIIDKDESASDSWVICDGITELVDLAALGAGGTVDGLSGDTGGTTTGATVAIAGGTNGVDTVRSSDTITINLDLTEISGTASGLNAGTATALAANGGNCAAGEYPLGVDASGAVESCTDATTEITSLLNASGGAGLTASGGVLALATSEASSISSGTTAPANDGALVIDTNGGTGVTNDVLAFQSGGEDFFVFAVREYPTTNGQVLKYNSANADVEWAADSTGGSPTFDSIASGTNTTATMIVGSGGSIIPSGSGAVFATGVVASAGSAPTTSGSVAYDSTSNTLEFGENGTNRTVANLDGTQTFTNKTLNAEATGNVVVIPERVWFPAAGCNGSTAGPFYDLPASAAAAPACVTGTNTQKGVLDFDAGSDEAGQITQMLPLDWTGQLDVRFKWFAAATSGSVVWAVQTACVADAETDDPAFNAANTVTDAAKGTTLQTNDATISTLTITGCAAGELLHLRISRDADNGSDDMTGDARLIGVELTYRRAA